MSRPRGGRPRGRTGGAGRGPSRGVLGGGGGGGVGRNGNRSGCSYAVAAIALAALLLVIAGGAFIGIGIAAVQS